MNKSQSCTCTGKRWSASPPKRGLLFLLLITLGTFIPAASTWAATTLTDIELDGNTAYDGTPGATDWCASGTWG